MALAIKISSYISAGYTNPVIWRLYEQGTGTFVDDHQEMGPHGVVYNFAFTENIRDVVYRIDLYEQPGGTGIGTLIKSHVLTVSTSTITFDADIELVVDGGQDYDPVSGQSTSPPNPNLVGKDYYVEQRGIGKLLQTRNVEVTTDNTEGNGTFSLVVGTFNPFDVYMVKIRPQFVINPAGSQGLGVYKDVVLVTSDIILTGVDFGKLFIVDSMAKVVTIQLPAIASILEKLGIWIQSVGTNHNNVIIKAATGETINGNGMVLNQFILSKAMKAEIILLSGTLYGNCDDSDINNRCRVEYSYNIGVNRLPLDGSSVLIAEYPGLKQAFDNLPANSVCTETQWNSSTTVPYVIRIIDNTGGQETQETKVIYPYKGKFALSADGLSIILPDLRNRFIRSLRYLDSTVDGERSVQGAGGYQIDNLKGHNHDLEICNSDAGAGKVAVGGDAPEGSPVYTRFTGGSETRGENIGLIPQTIF